MMFKSGILFLFLIASLNSQASPPPTPVVPGVPNGFSPCANENQQCNFSGTAQVLFGANGSYNIQTLSAGTLCTNAVFGDPAVALGKECFYKPVPTPAQSVPAGYLFCANEGQQCNFSGTAQVMFGTNGQYFTKAIGNGTACSTAVFGDPAYGLGKQCYYQLTSQPMGSPAQNVPPGFSFCGNEGQSCDFTGAAQVLFGTNGHYATLIETGGVSCNNSVFGDPAYGFAKQCYYRSIPNQTFAGTLVTADLQLGQDVGAQINAADQLLGSAYGTIQVLNSVSTTVSTPVTLGDCHNLFLGKSLSWNLPLTLRGNNHVYGIDSTTSQTFTFTGPWLIASSISSVELDHVWGNWTTVLGGDNGNRLLYCKGCSTLFVHDNSLSGGGYIKTDSTASNYAQVNSANSSYNVVASNNFVDGIIGPSSGSQGVDGAVYQFTFNVTDLDVQCKNVRFCRYGWGGNNNLEWTSYASSTIKSGQMNFIGGTELNTTAGDWWSMTYGITDTGVYVNGCTDVCLDPEGSQNVMINNFYATNATNGELSAFFHDSSVVFQNGAAVHTAPTVGFAAFTNNPTNDANQSHDVTFDSIFFNCASTSANCAMQFDPVLHLSIQNSLITNTVIKNSPSATMAGNESITNNVFNYTLSGITPWKAVDVSTQGVFQAVVQGNQITNTASQPAQTSAIYALNNYVNSTVMPVMISGNTVTGWPWDLSLNVLGNSTSAMPTFNSSGNTYNDHAFNLGNAVPAVFNMSDLN